MTRNWRHRAIWKSMPPQLRIFIENNPSFVACIVLCLIFSLFVPKFFSISNLVNILDIVSLTMITASTMGLVIMLGSIDLSLEGISGLACVVASVFVRNAMTPFAIGYWAIPIAILVGMIGGLINGVIHTYVKIPSFMITFCMGSIMTGVGVLIIKGVAVVVRDDSIRWLALGRIFGIPFSFIIAVLIVIILDLFHKKTIHGRYISMIGGDEGIVRDLGINVRKIKIVLFGLVGMVYGLVGVLLVAKLGSGHPYNSWDMNFEAISACLIGGIAITGGVGNIGKAVVGSFIIVILKNGMILLNIDPYVQAGIVGVITIAIVALTIDREKITILK